jgi:hypothetical protein
MCVVYAVKARPGPQNLSDGDSTLETSRLKQLNLQAFSMGTAGLEPATSRV